MSDGDNESGEVKLAHEEANRNENPASLVAQWMEESTYGTLSTISTAKGVEGFPHGSIVPFAISSDGYPYILIAEIAAHTKNLLNSSKSCLFLSHPTPEGDPQSHWRVGLMGNFTRVVSDSRQSELSSDKLEKSLILPDEEIDNMLTRYCHRVPSAESYLKTHNFYFWKMASIERVRYIAGFGRICWIDGQEVVSEISDPDFQSITHESIEHMNEDHEDAMLDICEGMSKIKPKSVKMVDLDPGGLILHTKEPEHKIYYSFGKRIKPEQVRVEIINLLKRSRKLM